MKNSGLLCIILYILWLFSLCSHKFKIPCNRTWMNNHTQIWFFFLSAKCGILNVNKSTNVINCNHDFVHEIPVYNFPTFSFFFFQFLREKFGLVTQSCLTLSNPMHWSMPGFPVHHQLPELAQTHADQVGDAIQPSHPLSSPLLLTSIFPSIRIFSNELVLYIRWPKYWSFSFKLFEV